MNKEERQIYERARYAANPERYRQKAREYRAKYREKVLVARRKWARKWRNTNPELAKQREKEWRRANPETMRRMGWRRQGLPEPTRPQPANCECCGRAPQNATLVLDHCHTTGKFRGWLCVNCNTGLGKFDDNLSGVLKVVAYLKASEQRLVSIDSDALVS